MIGSERGDMEKNLKTYLHKMAEMAADVCFPRRCPVCGKVIEYSGQLICPECNQSVAGSSAGVSEVWKRGRGRKDGVLF